MDDSDKDKLKDVLSAIDPVEFQWDNNMSTQTGIVAQEIDCATITLSNSYDTISINPADLSITGAIGTSGPYFVGGGGNAGYSFSSQPTVSISSNTDNKNYIQTPKSKIDIDELADMMETLKKRLLILAPNFEMHEKYPMLKELYNEYKAMEKLLSGPDSDEQ